jgi:chromosome segregation ATPase
VPELNFDAEAATKRDLRHLEESLQKLWEKARLVSDAIIRLKEERKELQGRVSSLEATEGRLSSEVRDKEQQIRELRAQLAELQSNGSGVFNLHEREEMKIRLKELIAKIGSRL